MSMEKLKIHSNGQWELRKDDPASLDHYSFQNRFKDNVFTGKDVLKHQEIALGKALKYNKNSVKNMANEKGEIEPHILLHRGITHYDPTKTDEYNSFKVDPTHVESKDNSVNTLLPHIAQAYSIGHPKDEHGDELLERDWGSQKPTNGKVFSFWVPHSKIHHMGGYNGKGKEIDDHAEEQKHTSIQPGKFTRATPEEVALLNYDKKDGVGASYNPVKRK